MNNFSLPRNLDKWTIFNLLTTYFRTKRKDLQDFIFIEISIRANKKND